MRKEVNKGEGRYFRSFVARMEEDTFYSGSEEEDFGDSGEEFEPDDMDALEREQMFEELGAVLMLVEGEQPLLDWKQEDRVSCQPAFKPRGQVGPTFTQAPDSASGFFGLFLDQNYLQRVTYFTNKNAFSRREDDGDKGDWTILTVEELKAYIGVSIVIETHFKERLAELWSTSDKYFLTHTPGIQKIFTRDRYSQITRYLHFCDESKAVPRNDADYDKLYKIHQFLAHIRQRFQELYIPNQELAVDECMVPFRGRLGFRQYIKDKPVKWGIKVFMLADSHNGYNYNFEVYTGRDCCYGNVVSNMGLGQRCVLTLTKPVHELGYHIFFDRFFTSPVLLHQLRQLRLSGCGTIMCHRIGFPADIKKQPHDLQQGDYEWRLCHNTGMVATVWCDKKPIYFLSNIHIAQREGLQIARSDGTGGKINVNATPTVLEYNRHMGGVDLNDKMTSIDRSRRTYKWYHRLYRKGIMWCMYNAYILEGFFVDHSPKNKRKRDFRSFCLDVSHELVGDYRRKNPTFTRTNVATAQRFTAEDHFPVLGEGRDHRCVVCYERYTKFVKAQPDVHYSDIPHDFKPKKTAFICTSQHCGVHLCIKNDSKCWQKWHTNVEYWR